MAKNEVIGHTACPLCKFPQQEIRVSSNNKPYIVCDECGAQLFSRQARSVKIMRDMAAGTHVAVSEDIGDPRLVKTARTVEQIAKPAPAAQPAPVAKHAPVVKAAPVAPVPAAQPEPVKPVTIFDTEFWKGKGHE